jgi:hypothetical protein
MPAFRSMSQWAGQNLLHGLARHPARTFLQRRFSRRARFRIAIYYEATPISKAQVYPFLHYAHQLRQRYGAEVRCYPVAPLLEGAGPSPDPADAILLQIWFDRPHDRIRRVLDSLRALNPDTPITFVDSFAHNDLRLGRVLNEQISFYTKKSLFRDSAHFFTPFRGDTNLTQYYGDLLAVPSQPVDWQVPPDLLPKLRLSPNFFTAPRFLALFPFPKALPCNRRTLDIQTRFDETGTPWYQAMRKSAAAHVRAIPGISVSGPEKFSLKLYSDELRRSRLCFSPFGYGEVCWRDIEAIMAGAVLVKPDMGHLDTLPNLYEAGVTYLPVRWDFSDLEEVVTTALRDPARCEVIALEAYRRISDYVRSARFVDDVAFLAPQGL